MSQMIRNDASPSSPVTAGLPARSDAPSITQACFNDVLKLRQPLSAAEIERTYNDLRASLDTLLTGFDAFGLDAQTAGDIAYAVAALADEIAAKQGGPLSMFWLPRSLQFHFFDDNTAGEGFYQRLELVRHDPARRAALQAYYVALALGFEGRYGLAGGSQAITTLMGSVRQALVASAALQGSRLSAHGLPVETDETALRRATPTTLWAALALGTGVVAWGAMHLILQQATAAVVHAADTLFCQGLG